MTAKEMFLQIGYVEEEDEQAITYENDDYKITFTKKNHFVWKESLFDNEFSSLLVSYEIKAINKKLKELGW